MKYFLKLATGRLPEGPLLAIFGPKINLQIAEGPEIKFLSGRAGRGS
jgi:hypothetical protein